MREFFIRVLTSLIIIVAGGLLFGYVAASIGNESITNFDLTIIAFVQGFETPWLTIIMKFFTWIGSRNIVSFISAIAFCLLFFAYKRRKQAFLFVMIIGGTIWLNWLLKLYFFRDRPEIHRIIDISGFSFPSGHAMMAFSLYAIIAHTAWRNLKTMRRRLIVLIFATFMILLISMSRIYLGVHYPSDIVGGITASAIWTTTVVTIFGAFPEKSRNKKGRKHV